ASAPPLPATARQHDGRVPPAPLDPAAKPRPTGLTLDRDGLLIHASGNISEIFGPLFRPQDRWERVCRMPEPPLLLADRVVGLDAEPASMGTGTIWTETDVRTDSWYLHDGRMPAGIMIEAGQADLMLISYLGIDLLNKGERVYRLLGCQLTYHRDLPRPGETLRYDIHVDGHASHGPVRLFFFHYDCEIDGQPAISVRQGQAGFFTDAELADSAGILWTPEGQEIVADPRLDPPEIPCRRTAFSRERIAAFAEGRTFDCFGPGFEYARTHNRPPSIQRGRMLFLHEVTELAPRGGPWGRGYLRAVQHLSDDDWFYDGHFKNDPCMPGTLMFEGCLQAMSFYLAAMGVTVHRDGWRFQPVIGEPFDLRCRGQAIPGNRELVYEVFVEEFVAGPVPTLYADLLCTIDGLKAFHARRVGLQLVPDWPITSMPELWDDPVPPGAPADHASRPVASLDGFAFDYRSLLACAWGRPSDAFGPMYARFDGHRRVARLPGPPYHFMSRVTRIDGPRPVTEVGGRLVPGAEVELEFDVDPGAWYFHENGAETMPFCVFLEAALQPCGWLASYVGSALTEERDLSFRNLDGVATWDGELLRDAGTLRTCVRIVQISKTAGMIIEGFDVRCLLTDPDGTERTVYTMHTVFGFFPKEALENQVGLPTDAEQRAFLTDPSDFTLDLRTRPDRYFARSARLASPMLCMLDRITGFWPEGGAAGLGRVRGEKDVDPGEWFFKAHFFQDPVQPGSLGLEALLQLLQWFMLHQGMDEGMTAPRFEPLMQGRELKWKYRGQVVPGNKVIQTTMEITERGVDEHGPYVIGNGSLWVDGKRIYEVEGMGMRLVERPTCSEEEARARRPLAATPRHRAPADETPSSADPTPVPAGTAVDILVDPAVDGWTADHRPTWTVPALPMMVVADMLARPVAAAGRTVTGLRDVKLARWVTVEGPTRLRARVRDREPGRSTVVLTEGEETVASGVVLHGSRPPAPRARGGFSGPHAADPYAAGHLFHGPAFRLVRDLVQTDRGASAVLQAPAGAHPRSVLHPALLDGATHPIPHDSLHRWIPGLPEGLVAYPAVLLSADFYGPTPDLQAQVRCDVRPDGDLGAPELPVFDIELSTADGVWARLRLAEACFPKGPLGRAAPPDRVAFLRDRRFVAGLRLSRVGSDGSTHLTAREVDATDWLPGTVATLYGTRDPTEIARREHIAHIVGVHPAVVDQALPLNVIEVDVSERDGEVVVRGGGVERLDLSPVEDFWAEWFSMGDRWPAEDLYYGLMRRFIRRVVLVDPDGWQSVRGRPLLYLANHQVGVESLLFSILSGGLTEIPTVTVAKAEHRHSWLGGLIRHCFSWPGVVDPHVITYFQRQDRASLVAIIQELARGLVTPMQGKGGRTAPGQSVMVHVEGTRSLSCRRPVQKMSGAFIDMALETGTPIVPVRFTGGLPAEPLDARIEFPVGLGSQDVWIGGPLHPEALAALPYGERKKRVIEAINRLGPANADEQPHEGDPGLEAAVA
ncbi:MAG: 3-hydroxyacyl-[acyl-carrier-protein] dehydratase FabA, partial [Deltaproteobacteria bacterium]